MGQTSSVPSEGANERLSSPMVRPPKGWTNDETEYFQQISPVSDISNPSQFRHRMQPGKAEVSQNIHRGNVRRTSKVCAGKTPARKRHSGKPSMPAPNRFYFPEGDELKTRQRAPPQKRQPRWKLCKRRFKANIGSLGNCCKPVQDPELMEMQSRLGASVPVYDKNEKLTHHQVLADMASEPSDGTDPVIGLSVDRAAFDMNISRLKDITNGAANVKNLQEHELGERMAPYLQFLEAATNSPPQAHDGADDEHAIDKLRRNNTDDSVIMEQSEMSNSTDDNVQERGCEKKMVVARFQPIYRELEPKARMLNESDVSLHSPDEYMKRLASNPETGQKNSQASSCLSREVDSPTAGEESDMSKACEEKRKSHISENTHRTQSTVLAEPSAIVKMQVQQAADLMASPVAALFSYEEPSPRETKESSDSNNERSVPIVEKAHGMQATLFSDMGSEIDPDDLDGLVVTPMQRVGHESIPLKGNDDAGQYHGGTQRLSGVSEATQSTIIREQLNANLSENQREKKRVSFDTRSTISNADDESTQIQGVPESSPSREGVKQNVQDHTSENKSLGALIPNQAARSSGIRTSRRSSSTGGGLPGLLHMAGWKDAAKHKARLIEKSRSMEEPTEGNTRTKPHEEKPTTKKHIQRQSDPLPARRIPHATTTADMLRQTYSFFEQMKNESEADDRRLTVQSAPASLAQRDYRTMALGVSTRSPENSRSARLPTVSPAGSVDTTSTTSSVPVLSDQVRNNAAFLFSPSYNGEAYPGVEKSATDSMTLTASESQSISTLGSHEREGALSTHQPITIPVARGLTRDSDNASKRSERRVRFSDLNEAETKTQPPLVVIPRIENKLSDLSDATGIDSLPAPSSSRMKDPIATIDEEEPDHEVTDSQSGQPKGSQWGYKGDSSIGMGVTPLRSGKSIAHATNSPYLRFQQARTKFSGSEDSVSTATSTKVSCEKEQDHVKRSIGSVVSLRIAEMEGKKTCTVPVFPSSSVTNVKKGWARESNANTRRTEDVFATNEPTPSDSEDLNETLPVENVTNSIWRNVPQASESDRNGYSAPSKQNEQKTKRNDSILRQSHQSFDAGSGNAAIEAIMNPAAADTSDDVSGADSLTDIFKSHRAHIEQDSSADLSDDDFEEMLHYQQDISADYSVDEDEDADTVSTIKQDRPSTGGGQFASYRLGLDSASIMSSDSEGTLSTIRQTRQSNVSAQSSKILIEQSALPFRKQAPVKPTEQIVHRQIGPAQHNTEKSPARKWRDLAAAAQERDSQRKSNKNNGFVRQGLAERSVNTLR